MNLHLAMGVFVEVATQGGFAPAARRLGLSPTAVSRHVADLERELGVTLLIRNTRSVRLTEVGAGYLPRARAVLEEMTRLHSEIGEIDGTPRGRLRVTAPPAIGRNWIAPMVVDFIAAYPEVDVELSLTGRKVDLVAEGFDCAIREGHLRDSSLIVRRIAVMPYQLCASPAYLEARGRPQTPQDLAAHDCLVWWATSDRAEWTLWRGDQSVTVPVRRRLVVNDLETLRAAVRRGLGITFLPTFDLVANDLESGLLEGILLDYAPYHGVVSLVRPPAPFEAAKVRIFIDFITEELKRRARGTSILQSLFKAPAEAPTGPPACP